MESKDSRGARGRPGGGGWSPPAPPPAGYVAVCMEFILHEILKYKLNNLLKLLIFL